MNDYYVLFKLKIIYKNDTLYFRKKLQMRTCVYSEWYDTIEVLSDLSVLKRHSF